ncbi:MAG: translation initiation factor IF-3 [Alphaproteobacteria bacterium]
MAYPPKKTNHLTKPASRPFVSHKKNTERAGQGGQAVSQNSQNTAGRKNGTTAGNFTPRPSPRPFIHRSSGAPRQPFVSRLPRPMNMGDRWRGGRTKDRTKINNNIAAREVMLIDEAGKKIGVVGRDVALQKARDAELDLVEITASANPPVCKILDYGKYKYQEVKRKKEAKRKQKVVHVKEIQIRHGIDQHDLLVKMKKIQNFLEDGDKVRVAVRMFGRAPNQRELAMAIFQKVLDFVGDLAKVEKSAEMDVAKRRLTMMLARNPLKKIVKKESVKHGQDERTNNVII